MIIIFLDTETTGLDPFKHRILEIAFQLFDLPKKQVIAQYEAIVRQSPSVMSVADPKSLIINGFSLELTAQGKSEEEVAGEIIALFQTLDLGNKEAVFLCQNPAFDRSFFQQLISIQDQKLMHWPYHWLDLASMYWARQGGSISEEKQISKNAIAIALGLPKEREPHRAMNGVRHLMQCYQALFQLQKTMSV